MFILNTYKAIVENFKIGTSNIKEGVINKDPSLLADGLKKIVASSTAGQFLSIYTLSQIIPKYTWEYILKSMKNMV